MDIISDWKYPHWLSERLASFSIMGAYLRVLLKPLNTIVLCDALGFQGGPQLSPHEAERRQALRQLKLLCFQTDYNRMNDMI